MISEENELSSHSGRHHKIWKLFIYFASCPTSDSGSVTLNIETIGSYYEERENKKAIKKDITCSGMCILFLLHVR